MTPPDEHESAVAAWLADPTAQREVGILKKNFPAWRESDVYMVALLLEMLVKMDFYGEPEIIVEKKDDDEPPEPWKDNDATGWKP